MSTEAVVLEWMALRAALFDWLGAAGVAYEGTRDAIVAGMTALDGRLAADLAFVYHVATMAEWDETFGVTEAQVRTVADASARLLTAFQSGWDRDPK
ncbi:hypothetical protein LPN01_18320 [Sphingomonas sp. A2-49]|uniref:hypothetical protein n=1 Tax=Sphingomonas sp. A2-49 TaxID=1391375 RepID=UPI0021D1B18C|nr:hypothetical protein [Sphingomonas sp. A2-49]MCU6456037.1 hypothetical protein [Sphingomonas sp. A2-49]